MNGTAGKNSKVDPSRPVKAGFADQRRILPLCIAHQGRNLSPKGPTSSGLRVESPCGVEEHIQALPDYARTPSKSWDACGESSMGRGLTGTTGYGAVSPAVRDCGVNPPEDFLEHFFNRYLLESIVPFRMRNYVRKFVNDPNLQECLGKKRKVAACSYVIPIVVEYVVIMYLLL